MKSRSISEPYNPIEDFWKDIASRFRFVTSDDVEKAMLNKEYSRHMGPGTIIGRFEGWKIDVWESQLIRRICLIENEIIGSSMLCGLSTTWCSNCNCFSHYWLARCGSLKCKIVSELLKCKIGCRLKHLRAHNLLEFIEMGKLTSIEGSYMLFI